MTIESSPIAQRYPRTGSRSLVAAVVLVCGTLLAAAAFVMPHARMVLLAAVVPAITFAVAANRVRTGRVDYLEVFFPFSALYFIYFGVGAVYLRIRPDALPSIYLRDYLFPALGVTVLGYVAFAAAYEGFLSRAKRMQSVSLVPTGAMSVWVPGLIGFAGSMASVVQTRTVLARGGISAPISALQQFRPVFFFAWALAWLIFFNRSARSSLRWAGVLGLLPMTFAIAFLTVGGKALVLTLAGLPVLAYWYARRRLPAKTLLTVVLIGVFVIFPFYNTFRLQDRKAPTINRLEVTMRTISRWDQDDYMRRSVFGFLDRMSVVSSVAAIVRETGRWVDYRYGETLILAPIGLLVPRVLWPDKPNISIGREFGVTFNLVSALDKETQIAATVVGDFYWNFHLPGVIVGMFLLGLGYKWFYRRFGAAAEGQSIRTAIYLTLLATTLHFEGNFAMLVGGFLKTLAILMALVFLMVRIGVLESSHRADTPLPQGGPGESPVTP